MNNKLKIAVLEPFRSDYMDMPTGERMYWLGDEDDPYSTEGKTFHGKHVYETIIYTINELAPELSDRVQIDLLPNVKTGLLYARAHDYQIVNLSNEQIRTQDPKIGEVEKEISEDVMLVCSAGNDGSDGETEVSMRKHWLSVGAVDKYGNPKYYSSYGKDAVDVVGISGQYGWEGTSFSSPYVVSLIAIYYLKYYDVFGEWPTSYLARKWAIANAHDVFDEGYDMRTGFGLVCLPSEFTVQNLKVLTPSHPRIIMHTNDGKKVIVHEDNKEHIRMLEGKGFYKVGYFES